MKVKEAVFHEKKEPIRRMSWFVRVYSAKAALIRASLQRV